MINSMLIRTARTVLLALAASAAASQAAAQEVNLYTTREPGLI